MDYAALALVVAVFAGLAFAVWRRLRFVIRIGPDPSISIRGSLPTEFVEFIRELCREMSIGEGEIRGYDFNKRIVLNFSRTLPDAFRQRARNVWANRRI